MEKVVVLVGEGHCVHSAARATNPTCTTTNAFFITVAALAASDNIAPGLHDSGLCEAHALHTSQHDEHGVS